MLSKHLKARFCKDKKVNITLFDEPYFTERLELFDKLDEYRQFEKLIGTRFNGSEEEYFEYYNKIKDEIINYIKESAAFKHLNECDMNEYAVKNNFRQGDVYKVPFIGKKFISIDMIKANFSSLVAYGKMTGTDFNDGSFDWNKFMQRFTDIEYFYDSKYIRQVVFGNCNCKRQITFEKYLMDKLFNELDIDDKAVVSFCSDEIILDLEFISEDKLRDIADKARKFCLPLRVTEFKLGSIEGTKVFIKEILNENGYNTREIKCANPVHYVFAKRLLENQKITDNDLVFYSEYGRARLEEIPEIRLNFGDT